MNDYYYLKQEGVSKEKLEEKRKNLKEKYGIIINEQTMMSKVLANMEYAAQNTIQNLQNIFNFFK